MRLASAFFAPLALAVLLAGACPRAAHAQASDGTWERLAGPIDPPPAYDHQVLHDPVRHRMLLLAGGPHLEMWELPLPASGPTFWRRVNLDAAALGSRWGFAAVYDPLADRVLLFGGTRFDATLLREQYCNDVWELPLTGPPVCAEVHPDGTLPGVRSSSAAAFDPVRDRLLVFGGYPDGSTPEETWCLDLGGTPRWRQLSPLGGRTPPGLAGASAIYDPRKDRLVLFCGVGSMDYFGREVASTWALSLAGETRWDSLLTHAGPPVRWGSTAVMDDAHQELLVEGGSSDGGGHWYADAWALNLVSDRDWRQLPVSGAVPVVNGAHAAYSPERNSVIQYGGDHDPFQSQCDELALGTNEWSHIVSAVPEPSPTRRGLSTLLMDPDADRLLVFGGQGWGCQHDLWAFDITRRSWAQLPTDGVALVCGASNFVYDPIRRRLLAIGSFDRAFINQGLDEVWALPLREPRVWTKLATLGPLPPNRQKASFTYDSRRDRVLMFGGEIFGNRSQDSGESQDDLWELTLADTMRWRKLTPVGSPGPRQEHQALYDAARDRLLVFQGERSHGCSYYCAQDLDDSWALSLSGDSLVWRPFGPDPPVREQPVIDTRRDRVLQWAGDGTAWALSLSTPDAWQPLTLGGDVPETRKFTGLTFDPAGDRLICFGGYLDGQHAPVGTFTSDLFSLRFAPTPPSGPAPPPVLALAGAQPNPAIGELSLAFSLFDGSPATLDVFDLVGRRVAGRDVGALGPGRHVLPMGRFAPGIYIVRVTQGGHSSTLRAAVIR